MTLSIGMISQLNFKLLADLGHEVNITQNKESGRSFVSKGVLDKAKMIVDFNVAFIKNKISDKTPLVGIEPSAILMFRDEYPKLADDKKTAKEIASNTFTMEEFIVREFKKDNIPSKRFTAKYLTLKIHGHCRQKSHSGTEATFKIVSIPEKYKATIINSGCCGMAGSFGYEKEYYQISMQVGEDSLFPRIRNTYDEVVIVASGTSCRHQIKDGTAGDSIHPISVLRKALK